MHHLSKIIPFCINTICQTPWNSGALSFRQVHASLSSFVLFCFSSFYCFHIAATESHTVPGTEAVVREAGCAHSVQSYVAFTFNNLKTLIHLWNSTLNSKKFENVTIAAEIVKSCKKLQLKKIVTWKSEKALIVLILLFLEYRVNFFPILFCRNMLQSFIVKKWRKHALNGCKNICNFKNCLLASTRVMHDHLIALKRTYTY